MNLLELAKRERGPVAVVTADPDVFDVTFVYPPDPRSPCREVALVCAAAPGGVAPLERLADGVFVTTVSLPRGARVRYHFVTDPPCGASAEDLARATTARRLDRLNPRFDGVRIPALRTRLLSSLLTLPGAAPAPPRKHDGGRHATADVLSVRSDALGADRSVTVWVAPGSDCEVVPCVVLLDTVDEWGGAAFFDDVSAFASLPPFVGLLVRNGGDGRVRWSARLRDLNGTPALGAFIVSELLPAAAEHLGRSLDGGPVIVAGFSAAGAAAAAAALHERSIDGLVALSPSLHLSAAMRLTDEADAPTGPVLAAYRAARSAVRWAAAGLRFRGNL